jgi:hypothetical protein
VNMNKMRMEVRDTCSTSRMPRSTNPPLSGSYSSVPKTKKREEGYNKKRGDEKRRKEDDSKERGEVKKRG